MKIRKYIELLGVTFIRLGWRIIGFKVNDKGVLYDTYLRTRCSGGSVEIGVIKYSIDFVGNRKGD